MARVPIDEAKLTAAGILWQRDGDQVRLMIPGESHVCVANVGADGTMDLVPEQSHTHRALVVALGLR